MPPEVPFQRPALKVLPRVALAYCGTRTTWNLRWPSVALAAAFV